MSSKRCLAHVNEPQPGTRYVFWKQDGQIAQYRCVEQDRDYSAHRVYLSSRTARDRLIVSNSFGFKCFFHRSNFCTV